MPPKRSNKTIKIIPIDQVPEQEPKENIINEDTVEEPVKEEIIVEDIKEEPIEPVKNDVVLEPIKEEELVEPPPKPKGRKDRSEKVTCIDCGKTLTKKTYDYNHKYTCKTVKAHKKAEEIEAKLKEEEEQKQLKKQQEENKLREKLEKEIEEKYKQMNNKMSVEVPVVEKPPPPPPSTPKLTNMDIRRINHINRYSKLRSQLF